MNLEERKRYRYWKTSQTLTAICVICQLYAIIMIMCVPGYCIYLVFTRPHLDPACFTFSLCFSIFVVINMLVNWIGFQLKLRSAAQTIDKSTSYQLNANKEWSCCPICQVYIWRRDHHCFFLGGCVGMVNLLNFMCFCFYAFLGTAYASVIIVNYLCLEYKDLWSKDIVYYFIPFAMAKWLGGQLSFANLVTVSLLGIIITTSLSTLAIFILELYLIYTWKTSRELWRGDKITPLNSYPKSIHNFQKAFGKSWALKFIIPNINYDSSNHVTPCSPLFESLKLV